MPGAKKKAADPRFAELGGTVRKARQYGVFSQTSAEPGATLDLGSHQKREGVPPLKKRIGSIPTQIRGQGVKKFLRAPLLYD